ncbi:hypothetical protein ACIP98_34630 [Streptomyces sp. NPDC088354]|uniref:hypothetical protein n=1 Tax=unclassified Streptomyces TaxID=2593676 RepID=UPI0029A52E31|nr:hypothetical protein [Streptomyces sp. MI02-7b]MDX3074187.1 hypothetical protein [Streptomyces sp. MI02-7b]
MDLPDDMAPATVTQDLPIADYKHLPRISVEDRVGELDRDGAEKVLRYEREHRDRTPVIQLLIARLRQLRTSGGKTG